MIFIYSLLTIIMLLVILMFSVTVVREKRIIELEQTLADSSNTCEPNVRASLIEVHRGLTRSIADAEDSLKKYEQLIHDLEENNA